MTQKIIEATFKGQQGSCGYNQKQPYNLIIRHEFGNNIVIENKYGGGYCEYSSIISFLENWDKISEK